MICELCVARQLFQPWPSLLLSLLADIPLPALTNKVQFFEHCWFDGGMVEKGLGSYSTADMGMASNMLSSLRVPSGLQVTLYDLDLGGQQTTFTGPVDAICLVQYTATEGGNWNDKTSSFVISSTGMCLNVMGITCDCHGGAGYGQHQAPKQSV